MRTLEEIFKKNTGRIIHRHDHVIKIYDEYFSRFRGKAVSVLEIGIAHGGSLPMWKEYFGPQAKIYGMDVTDNTGNLKEDQIQILIGDQGDRKFLRSVKETLPKFDIIIDDASHESARQIVTLQEMFEHVNENGIYAIEDLHCAYRDLYGGGYKKADSIVEHTKDFIDFFHPQDLPAEARKGMPKYFDCVYGIHFFRNVLLIDKWDSSEMLAASPLMTGEGTVPDEFHTIKGGRFNA